jgi:glycosyltransferase involved in cell wall biosynthesis
MIISFNTNPGNLSINTGYGYAGFHMVTSLQKLGYKVPYKYDKAPVQISFCQPQFFDHKSNQYQIGYMPWESTEFKEGWLEELNSCDEVWTTSEWCKNIFIKAGIEKPIYVYHHGIEDIWTPLKRTRGNTLRFLHVGEPAPRKGGQMVLEAFMEVFGNDPSYRLTLKAHNQSTLRNHNKYNKNNIFNNIYNINDISNIYNNISIITNEVTTSQLVGLFHTHHALLYPSYGEGFGFIPLQALATGMPTICTGEWAPYKNYLHDLAVDSQYVDSPWHMMHPGLVVEPSYEDLKSKMIKVADDYETYSDKFFDQAKAVHEDYNWLQLTKNAFSRIEEKFSES